MDYLLNPYVRNAGYNNCTIKVSGNGSVTTKPDVAILSLGVVVEDEKLQIAQQQNALISNRVINELKKIGINQNQIETISYTIDQIYDYPNGKKIFRGYKVKHMLKITIKDISKVGEVIDVATQNGANIINNIEFTISNKDFYYNIALKKATKNARKKAIEIAKTLGVNINKIPIWVIENSNNIEQRLMRGTPRDITPIQEGEIKISSSITAAFQYRSW